MLTIEVEKSRPAWDSPWGQSRGGKQFEEAMETDLDTPTVVLVMVDLARAVLRLAKQGKNVDAT